MRAAAGTLTSLEVAIRRRGAALAGLQHVGVHAEAHRTAGVAPVEARVAEDAVETLFLRLRLDEHRAGNDQGANARLHAPAAHDLARDAQILEARVGA